MSISAMVIITRHVRARAKKSCQTCDVPGVLVVLRCRRCFFAHAPRNPDVSDSQMLDVSGILITRFHDSISTQVPEVEALLNLPGWSKSWSNAAKAGYAGENRPKRVLNKMSNLKARSAETQRS